MFRHLPRKGALGSLNTSLFMQSVLLLGVRPEAKIASQATESCSKGACREPEARCCQRCDERVQAKRGACKEERWSAL